MKKYVIPFSIASIFLMGAICFRWPYGYYTLLRLVVFILIGITSVQAWNDNRQWLGYSTALIVVIYNPLIRIHFTRDIWIFVNGVTILGFGVLLAIYKLEEKKNNADQGKKKNH